MFFLQRKMFQNESFITFKDSDLDEKVWSPCLIKFFEKDCSIYMKVSI